MSAIDRGTDTSASNCLTQRGEFQSDDYDEINKAYFKDILASRSWNALPAGWYNPHSAAASLFEPRIPDGDELQKYCLDEGGALGEQKHAILDLVGKWESRNVAYDELTLCPSVSTANLLVLIVLKNAEVSTVIFETPAYFATLRQAALLNLKTIRLPSFRNEAFEIGTSSFAEAIKSCDRCAVWITQPRFGIGTNRVQDKVRELGDAVGPNNFLVVDEAAEQKFPSLLSSLGKMRCPIFRMRGLLKGVGLNGLRVSFVLHPAEWREQFADVLEVSGASIDRFSLTNAAAISETPHLLAAMLSHANSQVQRQRETLETLTLGSWIEPTHLENSYIGTLMLDLNYMSGSYFEKRKRLLSFCRDSRMPIVLSASIGFAFDECWEGVRINYFTPDVNVENSVQILLNGQNYLR